MEKTSSGFKRCCCTTHGCRDVREPDPVNPNRLIQGRLLARKLRSSHQADDRAAILRARQAPYVPTSSQEFSSASQELKHDSSADYQETRHNPTQADTSVGSPTRPSKSQRKIEKKIKKLKEIEDELMVRKKELLDSFTDLVFAEQPGLGGNVGAADSAASNITASQNKLLYHEPRNQAVIHYEEWLLSALMAVDRVSDTSLANFKAELLEKLEDGFTELETLKRKCWQEQKDSFITSESSSEKNSIRSYSVNTERYMNSALRHADPLVVCVCLIVTILHLLCNVSLRHCAWLLAGLKCLSWLGLNYQSRTSSDHGILKEIPSDPRTAFRLFDLKPAFKSYVCCPKCFALYPIDDDSDRSYPANCTNQDTPSSAVCGRNLKKSRTINGKSIESPCRKFIYHDPRDWIASLVCRPGMELYLDRNIAGAGTNDDRNSTKAKDAEYKFVQGLIDESYLMSNLASSSTVMHDIWDSPAFNEFLGPDKKPFVKKCGSEGRYIFSLSMDGFNPYQNKEAGKKVSVAAIYMVCLNLPPEIRYKTENVFLVGVIPGPHEPSIHQMNHIIRPLVDDFIDLYDPGIELSSTPMHPDGRKIRCCIGPLICDLPATRQMAGLASHASNHFCSFCSQKRDKINEIEYWKWALARPASKQRALAEEWRDAESESVRLKLFLANGLRYSELQRLSYREMQDWTLLDAMHNILLGNLKRHCREFFGMDVKMADGDGAEYGLLDEIREEDMVKARNILHYSPATRLRGVGVSLLRRLCFESQLVPLDKTKAECVKTLLAYRLRMGWFDISGKCLKPNPSVQQGGPSETDLQDFDHALQYSNGRAIKKFQKSVLLARAVARFKLPDPESYTKNMLVDMFCEYRRQENIVDDDGNAVQLSPEEYARQLRKSVVLGRNRLEEVWTDITKTTTPSWFTSAPKGVGLARTGKLSADQWRSTCTVHLVVTLVRLWGEDEDRYGQMLKNFMHLVDATKLAFKRSMTDMLAIKYQKSMYSYLKTARELYPQYNLFPNQHLSLHLGDLLRRFGPTHSWRMYVFERINYILQHIDTNKKFGDLELTMFNNFCMAQNIRVTMQNSNLPEELRNIYPFFQKAFDSDMRGTHLSDILALQNAAQNSQETDQLGPGTPCELDESTRCMFDAWKEVHPKEGQMFPGKVANAYQYNTLRHRGFTFKTKKALARDSEIVFGRGVPSDWAAGQIQDFIAINDKYKTLRVFAIIKKYRPLPKEYVMYDRYRQFELSGGRIYCQTFFEDASMIAKDEIIAHFAATPGVSDKIPIAHHHVLPLDKE